MFRKRMAESSAAASASLDVGKYFLVRSKLSNLVLDTVDGSTANNTAVAPAQESGADSQFWYLDIINGTIRNKGTNFSLSLDYHKNLIVSELDAACDDQNWELNGDFIVHSSSGKVLDISGANPSPGARICIWDKNDGNHQQWRLEHQGKEFFWIKSQFNGKVLDISGDSEEPGTEIITYDKKKKKKGSVDNQLWYEDYRGVIRSKLGPGFALDSSDGDIKTAVYDPRNEHHIWVRQDDKILNGPEHPDLLLDIKGKKRRNGGNLVGYEDNGGSNQRWEFVIDEEEDDD